MSVRIATAEDLYKNGVKEVSLKSANGLVVKIRKLKGPEMNKVSSRKQKNIVVKHDVKTGLPIAKESEMDKVLADNFEGDVLAIKFGLVEPKLTEEQIRELPTDIFEEIAISIYIETGVIKNEEDGDNDLESFR